MRGTQLLVLAFARRALLEQARLSREGLEPEPAEPTHDARVGHLVNTVYEAVLESFAAHQGVVKLNAQTSDLKAEIANLTLSNARLEDRLNGTNSSNASHVLISQPIVDPAIEAQAQALAARLVVVAEAPLVEEVTRLVSPELNLAAASAADRVLAQACDDAVVSAVQTSWKVSEELTGAVHADRISSLVREQVLKECMTKSEPVAADAEAAAARAAALDLPAIARERVAGIVREVALNQARAIIVEQIRAAAEAAARAANVSLPPANATLNATLAATTTTTPSPAAMMVTTTSTSTTTPVPSAMDVAGAMPSVEIPLPPLSDPPVPQPFEVTIGNVTIASGTPTPVAIPAGVDPRVYHAVEEEKMNSTVADDVARLAADMKDTWATSIASHISASVEAAPEAAP